jgi:hypothetical protein
MTKYALYNKRLNYYVGFYATFNDGADCAVSVSYELGNYQKIWLADSIEIAEYVRTHSTSWYNADYETPMNNLDAEDLEIRKVTFE